MNTESFGPAVGRLLEECGLSGQFDLQRLPGGANNRVFRVESSRGLALLKVYFQHPKDPRDRLGAEFGFCRFAWDNGLRCLPEPLACDPASRLGLYEFIQGRKLAPHEVAQPFVQQALSFYLELSRHKSLPSARELPNGSEACFTLSQHLHCVERRIQRLRTVDASLEVGQQAVRFIEDELSEVWKRIADSTRRRAIEGMALALDNEIPEADRCISPSDFGFHNALLTEDGTLRFIDFEYAGWDDPAKLVCDFFCQPEVPVSMDYYEGFAETVATPLTEPTMHLRRLGLLLPVYRIKWCCILLNDFLSVDEERRRFARSAEDPDTRKMEQLRKARHALANLAG
jgi:hypothetical protein